MAIADLISLDGDGLHTPDFPTVLDEFKAEYRGIYGADTYLEADSQDGQWIAVQARAAFDLMEVAVAVYNSFSPLTAQGDALSRQVKINGIRRLVPSNSTVDVVVSGAFGTVINNGIVEDTNGKRWTLPATVTIPAEAEITVTATAVDVGAIEAQAGTLTKIATPTRGWVSVTNPLALTSSQVGDPVESDAELRARQAESTMIPSLSVMEGITGAVASVDGVLRHRGYENDTNVEDENGIPGHTIALVVEGGQKVAIATAIHRKKTAGTGTWVGDWFSRPNEFDGNSVSTLAIGTGSKVFTTGSGLAWVTGMRLRAAKVDDYTQFMEGTVTTYVGTTLTMNIDVVGGSGTYSAWLIGLSFPGGTTEDIADEFGVVTAINFIRPTPVTISVEVTLTGETGFVEDTKAEIAAAVADYINGLKIGDDILLNRLFTPANLGNVGSGATFYIDEIQISRTGAMGLDTDNLTLDFNEVAVCDVAEDITFVGP